MTKVGLYAIGTSTTLESNKSLWFFPYMSNSDLVLAMLAWLVGEERAPTMKPPIEVLSTVVLTQRQVYGIFAVTALGLPGLVATIGGVVWWRRRR